jgi:hypothetical protein
MKIELVKISGNIAGYNLVAEHEEERVALDAVRELHLGGDNENQPPVRYDGFDGVQEECLIWRLKFVQNSYAAHDMKSLSRLGEVEIVEVKDDFSKRSYLRCSECGSKNVQMKAWVNPNKSNEFIDYTSDHDEADDCWCEDCMENLELEFVEVKRKRRKNIEP